MPDLASPSAARRRPSSDDLITLDQRAALLANGRWSAAGEDIAPRPVVRLFTSDANATWLLT